MPPLKSARFSYLLETDYISFTMEKISGLVLDRYDDPEGVVLRTIFPGELPELVKSAAALSYEVRARLPEDTFALVLVDSDVELRKFAMADGGNTALSVEYFLKMGHKLPVEAQKVAAANLVRGCGWYGIEPPEALQKIALGLGTLLGGALIAPGQVREAKANMAAVQGAAPGIMTPDQIKARRMQMGAA